MRVYPPAKIYTVLKFVCVAIKPCVQYFRQKVKPCFVNVDIAVYEVTFAVVCVNKIGVHVNATFFSIEGDLCKINLAVLLFDFVKLFADCVRNCICNVIKEFFK